METKPSTEVEIAEQDRRTPVEKTMESAAEIVAALVILTMAINRHTKNVLALHQQATGGHEKK